MLLSAFLRACCTFSCHFTIDGGQFCFQLSSASIPFSTFMLRLQEEPMGELSKGPWSPSVLSSSLVRGMQSCCMLSFWKDETRMLRLEFLLCHSGFHCSCNSPICCSVARPHPAGCFTDAGEMQVLQGLYSELPQQRMVQKQLKAGSVHKFTLWFCPFWFLCSW